jgi:hypothetical protein
MISWAYSGMRLRFSPARSTPAKFLASLHKLIPVWRTLILGNNRGSSQTGGNLPPLPRVSIHLLFASLFRRCPPAAGPRLNSVGAPRLTDPYAFLAN